MSPAIPAVNPRNPTYESLDPKPYTLNPTPHPKLALAQLTMYARAALTEGPPSIFRDTMRETPLSHGGMPGWLAVPCATGSSSSLVWGSPTGLPKASRARPGLQGHELFRPARAARTFTSLLFPSCLSRCLIVWNPDTYF